MSDKLPRIYYLSGKEPRLLPEWAYFFLRLGQQLALTRVDGRLVIALAVPTRAFACSLVATGAVIAKAGSSQFDHQSQVQFIRGLAPGTPVHVRRDNNKKLKGIIDRFEERTDGHFIFIRTSKSETIGFPLDRYAFRITLSESEVKLPKYQGGKLVETPSSFLRKCLGNELAQRHILDSSLRTLIIGEKSIIRSEVCETEFFCTTNDEQWERGYLQDVLRVREFSGANISYHVQCISSSTRNPENKTDNMEPLLVVFDGAIPYINHASRWRAACQVAVLDRTERQFSDAVELVNQSYAYRSDDSFGFPIKIPDDIEMMVFAERV